MPIRSPRWLFAATLVVNAPETPGVFELWENDEVVYVGETRQPDESLRASLLAQMRVHHATHFAWEITYRPGRRARELLEEYVAANRRLPRFNT